MVLMPSDYEKLKSGDKAPSFEIIATDNKIYSLESLKGKELTLIVFMCNHCPYVKPKIDELNRIAKEFSKEGVSVIGINSNESENYPEDSFENMQELVDNGKINFIYLHDRTQDVARSYGAVCTPDPFLFDKNLKLIFHSRIDDSHGTKDAKTREMYDAISEYLKIKKITMKENPSMGCSIKWKR